MKKIIIIGLAVIILVGIGIAYSMFLSGIGIDEKQYIYVDRDDNIDSVTSKLDATGADYSKTGFSILAKYLKYDGHVRIGRYEVSSDISTLQLVRDLRNHNSVPINVVVPSVRTVREMASRLGSQLMIDSAEIADYLYSDTTLQSLGLNEETLPSLFIPNTYEIYWETSAEALTARMKREHDAFWDGSRSDKARGIGLTPTEVHTLASIVDSETANNGEKPRVAGLYINRLKKNMLLQSDPTVIFAVGDFSIRRVLNQHLTVQSPYNTYKVQGLPPGPIRIPSVAGIDAVLNYEHHDYLYMCAKEDFSGTHNFATNIQEHYANARRYTAALNAKGIKK